MSEKSTPTQLLDYITQRRAQGSTVLWFSETRSPEYTLPAGCVLIEHPSLKLMEIIRKTPFLEQMWEEPDSRTEFYRWLHEGADSFFQRIFRLYQSDPSDSLARLLNSLRLFKDNLMYPMCKDDAMRIPLTDNLGLMGLTEVERKIAVASVLWNLPSLPYQFDEIYVPKRYFEKNKFLAGFDVDEVVHSQDMRLYIVEEYPPTASKTSTTRKRHNILTRKKGHSNDNFHT